MREGEVIGLTWDRIDFTKGTIKIDRQLLKEKKKGGSYVFAPPKRNSKRTIAPGADVMKRLEAVRLRQKERKLKAGPAWDNSLNLVFTNEIGGHYCHSTVEHTFKRIVTAMGLENRRFHDLRHTYAVLALRAGVDIKTLSKSLGHKTVAFTLDVYCHVTEEMQQEAASKMEAMRSTIKARAHRK